MVFLIISSVPNVQHIRYALHTRKNGWKLCFARLDLWTRFFMIQIKESTEEIEKTFWIQSLYFTNLNKI